MPALDPALLTRLDQLAQALGTTTAHLWQVLVWQGRLRVVILGVPLLLAGAGLVAWGRWLYRQPRPAPPAPDPLEVPRLLCGLALLGYLVVGVLAWQEIVIGLLNPAYYAMRRVLDVFE